MAPEDSADATEQADALASAPARLAAEGSRLPERSPFAGRSHGWWVGLAAFLVLFCTGFVIEFGDIDRGMAEPAGDTFLRYQLMLECFALLLAYVVPFFAFVRCTRLKAGVPRWLVALAFFAGWFVPGWIAGILNEGAAALVRMATSQRFADAWGDAIEAPIVEEAVKVLAVAAVLRLAGRDRAQDWLVCGRCVGMGFQVSEDLDYIEAQVAGSHADLVTAVPFTLGSRISGALVSHWTYTALMAVAAWLLLSERRRRTGLLLMLVPLLSHFAWDSPLGDLGALPLGVICALTAVPFLCVWGDVTFDDGRSLLSCRASEA